MKRIPEFKTKKELFAYLIANKSELLEFKRATFKFADSFVVTDAIATKALATSYKDDLSSGVIKRSIICNTYNWMDSHDDVHLDGVFSKSINENQAGIWHLHDHEQKITAKVGQPISVYEKAIPWGDLGVGLSGSTMCLMMDSNIRKDYNPMVFDMYLNKEINQHSVGMRYVQLDLALNDSESKAEFSTWNKYINLIGNRSKVEEQGYFWAVKEARLIENSAVLAGSNELTPTVDNKQTETAIEPKNKKSNIWSKLASEVK